MIIRAIERKCQYFEKRVYKIIPIYQLQDGFGAFSGAELADSASFIMTQLELGKQVVFPCTTERQRDIRPPLLIIDQEDFQGR